ncbi:MAG: hypothetical protein WCB14_04230 [Candidatus Acidiferrales bacterium]
MKSLRNIAIALAAILLFAPLLHAQDLSKYRSFSLETSLIEISKQVNARPADAIVMHPSPALIQELTYWPYRSYEASAPSEPVQEIAFSFYNGELYKMVVTYEGRSTQGMTPVDMVRAISAIYGDATVAAAAANPSDIGISGRTGAPIAMWGDAQHSLTLSRSLLSNAFQLVFVSRQLDAQADAAISDATKQAREDAPQKEIARAKKETDDLEAQRQTNLKVFRP